MYFYRTIDNIYCVLMYNYDLYAQSNIRFADDVHWIVSVAIVL